jgi:hypothetical protein
LQTLNLAYTAISDQGLEYLVELSGLTLLRLNNTAVTAGGMRRLQKALPNCILAMEPAISYPKVAVGAWTRVLNRAEEFQGREGVKFSNGIVELPAWNTLFVPDFRAEDVAIRARVKKPPGEGNLALKLRYKTNRWGCIAYFDGGRIFGMGQHKGKFVNFRGNVTPSEYKDFFEMTFVA